METTRRNLLTLFSSIPAIGLLGLAGGKEAEAAPSKGGDFTFNGSDWIRNNHLTRNRICRQEEAWELIKANLDATRNAYEFDAPLIDWYAINKRIVEALPDIFVPDRIMSGAGDVPTCHINGQLATARSRNCKAEYTYEFVQQLKSICGLDPEEELKNIIVDELAQEWRAAEKSHCGPNLERYVLCPYIPCIPVRAVDRATFTPKIKFMMRYGVVKENQWRKIA